VPKLPLSGGNTKRKMSEKSTGREGGRKERRKEGKN
jgi:hypothetical protein